MTDLHVTPDSPETALDRAVKDIALSPLFETDGTGFAATQRGLLRTTDGGKTWSDASFANPDLSSLPVTAVAVSSRFDHDGLVLIAIPGGVGRSTDRGSTWHFLQLPLPAPHVRVLAISPDSKLAFAATLQDGIFRSEDAGRTWAAWNFGLLDLSVQALAVLPTYVDNQTIFAGTSTGLARSQNGGRSWRSVDLPVDQPSITALAATAGMVVAGTEADGLFCSPNGESDWQACGDVAFRSLLALAEANQTIAALTDAGLAVSNNACRAWSRIDAGSFAPDELTCIALAEPGTIVAGDRSGNIHRIVM